MQIIPKNAIDPTKITVQISPPENLDNKAKKISVLTVQKQPSPEQPAKLTE